MRVKNRLLIIKQPLIIVTKVANQSIPNNVVTKVLLDTVLFNSGNFTFNSGTNDITINEQAWYTISYAYHWAAGVIGSRAAHIFVNGVFLTSDAVFINATVALPNHFSSRKIKLNAGDIVALHAYQGQGVALNLLAVANVCPMLTISFMDYA